MRPSPVPAVTTPPMPEPSARPSGGSPLPPAPQLPPLPAAAARHGQARGQQAPWQVPRCAAATAPAHGQPAATAHPAAAQGQGEAAAAGQDVWSPGEEGLEGADGGEDGARDSYEVEEEEDEEEDEEDHDEEEEDVDHYNKGAKWHAGRARRSAPQRAAEAKAARHLAELQRLLGGEGEGEGEGEGPQGRGGKGGQGIQANLAAWPEMGCGESVEARAAAARGRGPGAQGARPRGRKGGRGRVQLPGTLEQVFGTARAGQAEELLATYVGAALMAGAGGAEGRQGWARDGEDGQPPAKRRRLSQGRQVPGGAGRRCLAVLACLKLREGWGAGGRWRGWPTAAAAPVPPGAVAPPPGWAHMVAVLLPGYRWGPRGLGREGGEGRQGFRCLRSGLMLGRIRHPPATSSALASCMRPGVL